MDKAVYKIPEFSIMEAHSLTHGHSATNILTSGCWNDSLRIYHLWHYIYPLINEWNDYDEYNRIIKFMFLTNPAIQLGLADMLGTELKMTVWKRKVNCDKLTN